MDVPRVWSSVTQWFEISKSRQKLIHLGLFCNFSWFYGFFKRKFSLHIQNSSNCCRHKNHQSILWIFLIFISCGFLTVGPNCLYSAHQREAFNQRAPASYCVQAIFELKFLNQSKCQKTCELSKELRSWSQRACSTLSQFSHTTEKNHENECPLRLFSANQSKSVLETLWADPSKRKGFFFLEICQKDGFN